jgi:hypothetical protein
MFRMLKILAIAFVALIGLRVASIHAQALPPGGQPAAAFTPQQLQDEVSQLANDLDDPNYDYSKVPARMRQIFQDFGQVTSNMDPDRAQQFRMQLFQQIMPAIQRNQQKIQDAMQTDFVNQLQPDLQCTDEEFAALRPTLVKVVQAMRSTQGNGFGRGPGGPGGGGPQQNQQKLSPVQQAMQDLQAVLTDSETSSNNDEIQSKVDALRLAKDKAQQDLKIARDELRGLLTVRQEAMLVVDGILD